MLESRPKYLTFRKGRKGELYAYYRRGKYLKRLPVRDLSSDEFRAAYLAAELESLLPQGMRFAAAIFGGEREARSALAYLSRSSRERAASANRQHNLSPDYISELMARQDGRCALTGMKLSMTPSSASGRAPFAPSLDRIDSSIGYIDGNVRIVCRMANLARNVFSDSEFYTMCRAAAAKERRENGVKRHDGTGSKLSNKRGMP